MVCCGVLNGWMDEREERDERDGFEMFEMFDINNAGRYVSTWAKVVDGWVIEN